LHEKSAPIITQNGRQSTPPRASCQSKGRANVEFFAPPDPDDPALGAFAAAPGIARLRVFTQIHPLS
jgi:hypothetical protein